ncbi:FK506-binding protein 4-like isoform X2 [Centruroides sculpturatus]|uniref:FK506-binding protein 4-like isoform X2 n=1 Tax=Centruroides sculpturatus TaxID=218467 RepID=UPI000C6E0471|nr:FK506-binding protein 4-like isoform X2 [Centruroides sculpturatus]
MNELCTSILLVEEIPEGLSKIEQRRKRTNDSETNEIHHKRTRLTSNDKQTSEDEMESSEDDDDDDNQWERRNLEEKRNILRISVYKMRVIEDPEIFLRRSVLIHNTIRRLQVDMDQDHFIESTQNFVAKEIEVKTEGSIEGENNCLIGFMGYQDHPREELDQDNTKEFSNDMADYTDDDSDEDEEEEEELCSTKDYHDDRLSPKEPTGDVEERLTTGCLCYSDSWCRQDCNRDCSGTRRESNQCATEYRTVRNNNQGESVFDSVVYQSLLVSLES